MTVRSVKPRCLKQTFEKHSGKYFVNVSFMSRFQTQFFHATAVETKESRGGVRRAMKWKKRRRRQLKRGGRRTLGGLHLWRKEQQEDIIRRQMRQIKRAQSCGPVWQSPPWTFTHSSKLLFTQTEATVKHQHLHSLMEHLSAKTLLAEEMMT